MFLTIDCPVCGSALDPAREVRAHWHHRKHGARIACASCLTVCRVADIQTAHPTAIAEVAGGVIARATECVRTAREEGRLAEELERMRATRHTRALLRVPEVFAEAARGFRESARLVCNVQYPIGWNTPRRRALEPHKGEVEPGEAYRWSMRPASSPGTFSRNLLLREWRLPILEVSGTAFVLGPKVALGGETVFRPMLFELLNYQPEADDPNRVEAFLAPLDVVEPVRTV